MIKLNTKAITSGGYEYDVVLRKGSMGWIFAVHGTPGSWYMETLDHRTTDRIAIDDGQGWYLENLQPLMREARNAIYREGKL